MMQAQSEILEINKQESDNFEMAKRNKSNKRKLGTEEITEFLIKSYVFVNFPSASSSVIKANLKH